MRLQACGDGAAASKAHFHGVIMNFALDIKFAGAFAPAGKERRVPARRDPLSRKCVEKGGVERERPKGAEGNKEGARGRDEAGGER